MAWHMLRPALAMARSRLGGLIAVGCAVAGGAAMITGAGVLVESGIRSHAPVERLTAADVVVSADQFVVQDEDLDVRLRERVPVDAELVDALAKLPGVAAVAGDLSFPATIVGADATTDLPQPRSTGDGHDWAVMTLGDADLTGAAPETAGDVVLDSDTAAAAGAEVGAPVEVRSAASVETYRVSGLVQAPGTGLYFHSDTAARLAGRDDGPAAGTVDLIAVTVEPSAMVDTVAADILSALPGTDLEVAIGDDRGDVEALDAGSARTTLIALASSLSGTLLMIVGFIVAGALAVSVTGQRRELALLRAVGATPRQVRRLIAGQASVVAAMVLPLGVAAGYVLAGSFAQFLVSAGVMPAQLPLSWSPLPALAAGAALLAVVQLAARGAAMRTSRLPATEAVAESTVEPREPARLRTIIGFVLMGLALGNTVVPLFTRSEAAFIAVASGILPALIGLALAAPALVRATTGWLRRRLRRSVSAPTWLAVSNSHGYALRAAGAITVLAMAVAFTITQVFAQTTLGAAADADLTAGGQIDATITGEPISAAETAAITAAPGIEAAVPMIATSVVWPFEMDGKDRAEEFPMLCLGENASAVIDLGIVAGDIGELTGDTIALDESTAWVEGVEIGDELDLILADGTSVSPTVVATYERGFGFGKVIGATDLITTNSSRHWYDSVLVAGPPNAATDWAAEQPGLSAHAGGEAAGLAAGGAITPDRWINLVVSLALLGYVLLGVGNSLVAATTRRLGEFATLRLIGATPAQLLAMMRREAVITATLAVAAAYGLSLLPMTLLGVGFLGLPWPQGPLWVIPAIALLVSGLAYLATIVPARRALRVPATEFRSGTD